MTVNWSTPTDWDTVIRRAGGRRHYNSVRRVRAQLRRLRIARWLGDPENWPLLLRRGWQKELARRLGVSQATVSRDLRAVLATAPACPLCRRCVRMCQPLDSGRP